MGTDAVQYTDTGWSDGGRTDTGGIGTGVIDTSGTDTGGTDTGRTFREGLRASLQIPLSPKLVGSSRRCYWSD